MGATTMLAAPPPTIPWMTIFPSLRRNFVISAKLQRRQRRRYRDDPDDDDERIGGVGFAVLTALDSSRARGSVPSSTEIRTAAEFPLRDEKTDREEISAKERETIMEGIESSSTSLSGLDVLLALQSASAQKSSVTRRRSGARRKLSTAAEESGLDPGDVRPIVIRSNWAVRLRKLERDLQDLMMNAV